MKKDFVGGDDDFFVCEKLHPFSVSCSSFSKSLPVVRSLCFVLAVKVPRRQGDGQDDDDDDGKGDTEGGASGEAAGRLEVSLYCQC